MRFDEFSIKVDELKAKHPIWFDLNTDSIGSETDLSNIESVYSIKLPIEYKHFIMTYGGGYFCFTNVFSTNINSEWNIIEQNNRINLYNSHNFLAVSDNEVGDYYGYEIKNGYCNPKVKFYNHYLNQVEDTSYENLYEFLLKVGLRQG
jgi:hypothetical protein